MNTLERMSYIRKGSKEFVPIKVFIPKNKLPKDKSTQYKSRVGIVKKVNVLDYHVLLETKNNKLEERVFCIGELEVAKRQLTENGRVFKKWRETIMVSLLKDSIKNSRHYQQKFMDARNECFEIIDDMSKIFGSDKRIGDEELTELIKGI